MSGRARPGCWRTYGRSPFRLRVKDWFSITGRLYKVSLCASVTGEVGEVHALLVGTFLRSACKLLADARLSMLQAIYHELRHGHDHTAAFGRTLRSVERSHRSDGQEAQRSKGPRRRTRPAAAAAGSLPIVPRAAALMIFGNSASGSSQMHGRRAAWANNATARAQRRGSRACAGSTSLRSALCPCVHPRATGRCWRMNAMAVDLSSYELVWPTALFVAEGGRIARSSGPLWSERAKWLLTEALLGTTAVADFDDAANLKERQDVDPWASATSSPRSPVGGGQREWFAELINRADELPQASSPRPYWPQRHVQGLHSAIRSDARREFTRIIDGLYDNGYLAEAFGKECVDDDRYSLPEDPADIIERRCGIAGLWPLRPDTWDDNTFYGLLGVLHDLVSRPRQRWHHAFGGCGWHYAEFHAGPGRVLYRWKINFILRTAGIDYELATEGEDLGRLVTVTDDARAQLVHQVLNTTRLGVQERIEHAIALFRSRSTSSESKRSAIVALAGILEERRQLIRDELGKPDEGALFEIANRYALRHRRADQRGDYDPVFLDWIFWWFLATVELTNRLIAARK